MMPILVVDDSREDLLLMQRVLQQCKIQNPVTLFTSGKDCLAEVQNGSDESPCLILLDLVMSPLDGISFLQQLNKAGLSEKTMVVMISGLTDIKSIQRGYQLGAKTFLVKPITAEDILQLINSLRDLQVQNTEEGYILSPKQATEHRQSTTIERSMAVALSTCSSNQ